MNARSVLSSVQDPSAWAMVLPTVKNESSHFNCPHLEAASHTCSEAMSLVIKLAVNANHCGPLHSLSPGCPIVGLLSLS